MDIRRTAFDPNATIGSLAHYKLDRGITWDDEDTRLTELLIQATDKVNHDSNQRWTEETWLQTHECFPSCTKLHVGPVASFAISYFDEDNVEQTLDEDNYEVTYFPSIRITFIDPPETYDRKDAVQIEITTGEDNPSARKACYLLAGSWNENRESEVTGTIVSQVQLGYENLIKQLRNTFI